MEWAGPPLARGGDDSSCMSRVYCKKGMNVLENGSQSVKHQCTYQVHSPKVKVGLELKMWGKNEEFGFHVGFLTICRMSRWLSEDFKAEENT